MECEYMRMTPADKDARYVLDGTPQEFFELLSLGMSSQEDDSKESSSEESLPFHQTEAYRKKQSARMKRIWAARMKAKGASMKNPSVKDKGVVNAKLSASSRQKNMWTPELRAKMSERMRARHAMVRAKRSAPASLGLSPEDMARVKDEASELLRAAQGNASPQ
jgi:hypothetical protein